jgi:hypothetical protein
MRRKRFILGLAVVLCLGLGIAAPAGATTNTVVNVIGCASNDGALTVPSGVPITIHGNGFAQGTHGLIQDFLLKEHTTLTVTEETTSVYDLSGEWGAPVEFSPTFWATGLPDTNLGISLSPGQSILVSLGITFVHPLLVAYPPVGPSGDNGPYLITGEGPWDCLITGSA